MSLGKKRKLDETNLEGKDDQFQKRAKELCDIQVKRATDLAEVSISKMTPEERKLSYSVFQFPLISSDLTCNICEVDISKSVKVVDAECTSYKINGRMGKKESPFVLCLECFKKGKEKDGHKKDNSYSIIDKLDYPLFDSEWTAAEDIALLKAISMSGIDNWYQISEMMENKSPTDCEAHFYSFYYKSQKDPIPRIEEIGTVNRNTQHEPVLQEEILATNAKKKEDYLNSKYSDKGKREQRSKSHKNETNVDDNSKRQPNPVQDVRTLVGYMPKRGDFDNEYDDEAETRICEMEFNDEDTEEEVNLKFKVLEYYNARLDERIRRKKFVIERGLLDLKKVQKQEKKRSKEERDLINMMKPFARFSEKSEHERRVNNLLKEYNLRILLSQLKFFKSQGLTTLESIEQHVEEKKKEGKFNEKKEEALTFIKNQNSYQSMERSSRRRRALQISKDIQDSKKFDSLNEDEK